MAKFSKKLERAIDAFGQDGSRKNLNRAIRAEFARLRANEMKPKRPDHTIMIVDLETEETVHLAPWMVRRICKLALPVAERGSIDRAVLLYLENMVDRAADKRILLDMDRAEA